MKVKVRNYYVVQWTVGGVIMRLKGDCVDHFSPIDAYMRVMG